MIDLQKLSFAYRDLPILSDVNLRVGSGEFIGIIGPNGGGKTTLFKLILGFLQPTAGRVSLEVERHQIGYVPQRLDYDAHFPISTLELVLGGRLQRTRWFGRYRSEDRKAALEALERVGLAGAEHKPYSSLSGGQAQRALIARALCGEPKLLLLDEPVSCVDTAGEHDFFALLEEMRPHVTILMVTHHLDLAVQHVDRILAVHRTVDVMAPGEVCDHFGLGLYPPPGGEL